jgi:hypothetical protein
LAAAMPDNVRCDLSMWLETDADRDRLLGCWHLSSAHTNTAKISASGPRSRYGGPIIPERRRIVVASNHNILARTDKSDAKRLPTFAAVRRTCSSCPTHLVTATSKQRGLSSLGGLPTARKRFSFKQVRCGDYYGSTDERQCSRFSCPRNRLHGPSPPMRKNRRNL